MAISRKFLCRVLPDLFDLLRTIKQQWFTISNKEPYSVCVAWGTQRSSELFCLEMQYGDQFKIVGLGKNKLLEYLVDVRHSLGSNPGPSNPLLSNFDYVE